MTTSTGGVYHYYEMDEDQFDDWVASDSKGKYWWRFVGGVEPQTTLRASQRRSTVGRKKLTKIVKPKASKQRITPAAPVPELPKLKVSAKKGAPSIKTSSGVELPALSFDAQKKKSLKPNLKRKKTPIGKKITYKKGQKPKLKTPKLSAPGLPAAGSLLADLLKI